jgi:hypothetical protein
MKTCWVPVVFRNFWRENERKGVACGPTDVLSFRAPCFWREESAVLLARSSRLLALLGMTNFVGVVFGKADSVLAAKF